MRNAIKIMAAIALVGLAIVPGSVMVLADDGQNGGVLNADVGPVVPGLTPGVGGYKVFGPKAIATQSREAQGLVDGLLNDTRWGGTDIWEQTPDTVRASHTNTSNIDEDEIWVQGAIKISGQGWYTNSFSGPPYSGYFANCNTQMPNPGGYQTFVAHSWHHFYDSTWEEWNVETEDTMGHKRIVLACFVIGQSIGVGFEGSPPRKTESYSQVEDLCFVFFHW